MKTRSARCLLAFSALLFLGPVGVAWAQSASPSPTVTPSKPITETTTPASAATEASSPSPGATVAAKPQKPERSAEEKAARKAERLRKYDTNKDGRLDDNERAAMRADKAKASPTP